MAQKKYGDGSWDVVTKGGHEYHRFRKYYQGFDKQKEFTGKTKADVKRKVQKFEEDLADGLIIGAIPQTYKSEMKKKTFNDAIENVLNQTRLQEKKGNWSTLNASYENYIKPYPIGSKQFASLNNMDFINHFTILTGKYSLSTIKKVRTLINKVFDFYGMQSLISGIKLPKDENCATQKKQADFFTLEESELFYQSAYHKKAAGEFDAVPIGEYVYGRNAYYLVLIMYTGLRIGELYALKWKEINFENKTIHVTHSKERIKNSITGEYEWVYGSPKRPSSVRYVPLSKRGVEALENLKRTAISANPEDFVVISKNGIPGSQAALTRTLQSIMKRANIYREGFGLHDLRHTYGSMMLEKSYRVGQPIDVKILSELLGHKDIQTTLNIYVHIIQERKAAAVNILDL